MSGERPPKKTRPKLFGPLHVDQPRTPSSPTPPANLDSKTTITIDGKEIEIAADDMKTICELGRGTYGSVDKMKHRPTGSIIAVKRITHTVDSEEEKRLLMDLKVSMKSTSCPYTVKYYGAMYRQGDVWICMEVMTTSLDKFYKKVVDGGDKIPEAVLGKISYSVVHALYFLQMELKIMHRDVKPSNILINRQGNVKICDYGVSGQLVDSLAKTHNVGCKSYMSPERINPPPTQNGSGGYDVRSDVWSLGVTIMELAIGHYPFPKWQSLFEMLKVIVEDDPPRLPAEEFSPELGAFVNDCLQKDVSRRPKYAQLMEYEFIKKHEDAAVDSTWLNQILDQIEAEMEKT